MTSKEKILDISMLLGTAAAVIISSFAGFARECDELRESTFRLHILANSDSEADQRVKYALRDYMQAELGELFASCGSKDEAVARAESELSYIGQRANEYLQSVGCTYTAVCTVGNDEFPTRVYGDVTLPAGNYDALRVVLGEGGGQNWWCVLYPSVCVKAASAEKPIFPRRELYEQRKAAGRSTADSLKAQRGEVEYRFAIYDLIRNLFGLS